MIASHISYTQPKPAYIRASAKQLSYLDVLCSRLGTINRDKYQYCSSATASKHIELYEKRLAKREYLAHQPKQLSLV